MNNMNERLTSYTTSNIDTDITEQHKKTLDINNKAEWQKKQLNEFNQLIDAVYDTTKNTQDNNYLSEEKLIQAADFAFWSVLQILMKKLYDMKRNDVSHPISSLVYVDEKTGSLSVLFNFEDDENKTRMQTCMRIHTRAIPHLYRFFNERCPAIYASLGSTPCHIGKYFVTGPHLWLELY